MSSPNIKKRSVHITKFKWKWRIGAMNPFWIQYWRGNIYCSKYDFCVRIYNYWLFVLFVLYILFSLLWRKLFLYSSNQLLNACSSWKITFFNLEILINIISRIKFYLKIILKNGIKSINTEFMYKQYVKNQETKSKNYNTCQTLHNRR